MGCPDPDDLIAYAEGATTGAQLDAVDTHIDTCASCRAIVGELLGGDSSPATLGPGSSVDRFVITERLGAGGMGTVFRAHDPDLGRDVALKVVRSDRALHTDADRRLVLEAQAIARVSHPNIVSVFAVGTHGRSFFVAMELVSGMTLREWLRRTRPDPARIVEAFIAAGRGLAAAHDAGVIHRDFKPDNVMRSEQGEIKVLDFGLARLGESVAQSTEGSPTWSSDSGGLTATGTVMGTVPYMAPEQHVSGIVDARIDQYAFGVALWEALTGDLPFDQRSVDASRRAKVAGPPRLPRHVPRAVRRVLRRALASDPDDRFADMHALLDALTPSGSRRRTVAGVGLGVVVASLGVFATAEPSDACVADPRADEVWGPQRRDALAQAFRDSPLDDASWDRARRGIDRRVQALVEASETSCLHDNTGDRSEAHLQREEACLDARWLELDVLTEGWAEASPAQLADIPVIVAGLDDPRGCVEPTSDAEVSTSAADREAYREAELELARAHALSKRGETAPALRILESLRPRVEALDDANLTARVVREIGTQHGSAGESVEAERDLSRAYELALASGSDELAADIAVELVRVVGFGLSRPDDAENWARYARALVDRTGDREEAAWLEQQLGLLCQARMDDDEALEHHERAFAGLMQTDGYDHIRTTLAMTELANAARGAHQDELSVQYANEAYAMARDVAGPEHPITLEILGNLGLARLRVGDLEGALDALERSAEGIERVLGPDHPSLGAATHMLAEAAWHSGDHERWLQLAPRGLAIAQQIFGEEHLYTAEAHWKLGTRLLQLGRPDEAAEHLALAAPTLEATGEPDALLYAARARLDLARCRPSGARRELDLAAALIDRAKDGADPRDMAELELRWADTAAAVDVDVDAARLEAMRRRAQRNLAAAGEVGLPFSPDE